MTRSAGRSSAPGSRSTCQASAFTIYDTRVRPLPRHRRDGKDLMRRLGHASPVAAYRYLHAVDGRDAEIASALSELAAHGNAARLPRTIVVKH